MSRSDTKLDRKMMQLCRAVRSLSFVTDSSFAPVVLREEQAVKADRLQLLDPSSYVLRLTLEVPGAGQGLQEMTLNKEYVARSNVDDMVQMVAQSLTRSIQERLADKHAAS